MDGGCSKCSRFGRSSLPKPSLLCTDTFPPPPSSAHQESSDANSKFHQFGTGDLETLNKPGVRDALVAFHQRYYSANQMRLCIYGKESIADLEVSDHSRLAGQPPTLTHAWLSMPHHRGW